MGVKGVEEIKREKVFVPSGMTTRGVMDKYDLKESTAVDSHIMFTGTG